jgi:predicted dehydrogenase
VRHAIDIVQSGLIGRPVSFRGWHAEDYLADAAAPFSWRLDASLAGRSGSLGDLGWHIISIARALCGPIASLDALAHTAYPYRRSGDDPARTVENEDWAAMLVRFRNGAVGSIESSRIAHGRKMDISFELTCERGSIAFDGERANELSFYRADEAAAVQGFRTIRINGAHPGYGPFIPAPAHGLGFNDLKTIEIHAFLQAIAAGRNLAPDLDEACRIARICEAALAASASGARIESPEDGLTKPRVAA